MTIPRAPYFDGSQPCAQTDAEIFFGADIPEDYTRVDEGPLIKGEATALRICQGCRFRVDCLTYALDHREWYGVWGATTEQQRRRMLERRRAA